MGAHTGMAFALAHPERVSALVQITPAYDGSGRETEFESWDALADGLEHGGVEGFMAAWHPTVDPRWLDTATLVTRQRLERHRHPEAVADALRVVPRSRPFESLDQLESLELPVLVVGSRDESDPGTRLRSRRSTPAGSRAPSCSSRRRGSRRSPGRARSSRPRSRTSWRTTRRGRCRAG